MLIRSTAHPLPIRYTAHPTYSCRRSDVAVGLEQMEIEKMS